MSGIAVEYWYPMLQYTASQRAAAHIMNAVVSISMSPESFSSGDSVTGVDAAAGTAGASLNDASLVESSSIFLPGIISQSAKILLSKPYIPEQVIHEHGRPRRLHLVRRKARALA